VPLQSLLPHTRRIVSRFFQRRISLLVVVPVLASIFFVSFSSDHVTIPKDIVINEVMTSNASFAPDYEGDYPDWIELWNPTSNPLSLENYQLVHDEVDQWTFPPLTLQPNQYLVVYASGKNRTTGELHTSFLLSRNGEPVELHRPSGVDRFDIPQLPSNSSFGRQLGTPSDLCHFAYPTPGTQNVSECFKDATLGAPTLSHSSGFYDQSFTLEVDAPDPSRTLYYTLDGSFPDPVLNPVQTKKYTQPINISALPEITGPLSQIDTTITDPAMRFSEIFRNAPRTSTQIQPAVTVRIRSLYSEETTATFFIGKQHTQTLPVVSLLLNPAHLFDDETGIYVAGNIYKKWRNSNQFDPNYGWSTPANYSATGRAWERPHTQNPFDSVRFQYCTAVNCESPISIGIRTHGNASLINPMRSLRLYARNDYKTSGFTSDFFGLQYSGWSTLVLRNGGNNQRGMTDRFHFNDMFFQSAMKDFAATTQLFQPVNVYINGEYWGIHALGERYDEQFIAVKYGVNKNNVAIVDLNEPTTEPSDVMSHWESLVTQAETLSPTSMHQKNIESSMDVTSFFDYIIGHTYAGNTDWPANNTMMWRSLRTDTSTESLMDDQRWRWMIMDLDRIGASNDDPDVTATALLTRIGPDSQHPQARLLHGLLRFPELRQQFFARYEFHLNTTFSPTRMNNNLNALVAQVGTEMNRHEQRWLPLKPGEDFMTWPQRVEQVREFISQRPTELRKQLLVAQKNW
jgi:hypothetical protein